MDKKTKNTLWIGLVVLIIAFFVIKGGFTRTAVATGATVTRTVTTGATPGQPIDVTLSISGGTGKFGGILSENVPAGFTVTGITSSSLGVSGSASGKLTGSLFEIAFAADNVASPFVKYRLNSPATGGTYAISGTFAFAEGGPSGNTIGTTQIVTCQPVCTRPADLCIASTSNGCGGTCPWTVTKNSDADANCNNLVDNTELLSAISKWVSNTSPFNSNSILLQVITAWVNS